jgi:beta-glucosidase
MTLEEKVGQMTQVTLDVILTRDSNNAILEPQRIDTARLRDAVVNHHVGSILNVCTACQYREQWHTIISAIQEMAVKETASESLYYMVLMLFMEQVIRRARLFSLRRSAWRPHLIKI